MSSDPNKKVKLVFGCLDWRLHPQLEDYFTQNGEGADLCVTAGSIKGLIDPATQSYLIEQIGVSKRLHNCQAVILTMHLDCGAYGGSNAFEDLAAEIDNAKDQLNQAKKIVSQNFPELAIETYIIGLEKSAAGWNIKPEAI